MKYLIILALVGAVAAFSGSAEADLELSLPQIPGVSHAEFQQALSQLPPHLASLLGPLPPMSPGRQRIARKMAHAHLRLQRRTQPGITLNLEALSHLNLTPEQLSALLTPIDPASRNLAAAVSTSSSQLDVNQLLEGLPAGLADLFKPITFKPEQ